MTNNRIIFCVFVAFIISITIFYIFFVIYQPLSSDDLMQKKFFSQNFDSTKKILILGSSHVGRYNTTYINNYLLHNEENYSLYNLALARDKPSYRQNSLDNIISLKPVLVVYGISFRDFERPPDVVRSNIQKPQNFIPDPQELLHKLSFDINITKLTTTPNSPRLVTLNFLQNIGKNNSNHLPELPGPYYAPFYPPVTVHTIVIENETQLQHDYDEYIVSYRGIESPDENPDVLALKGIIHKLTENGIKVVIITDPESKLYLDNVPKSDKELFVSILNDISKKYNISVYYLHDKYSELNIWADPDHLTILEPANIVNENIAKIILQELSK